MCHKIEYALKTLKLLPLKIGSKFLSLIKTLIHQSIKKNSDTLYNGAVCGAIRPPK